MSSILDALEKIEATRDPLPPRRDDPGRGRWRVAALVLVAIVAGAAGAAFVRWGGTDTAPTGEPLVVAAAPTTLAVATTTVPATSTTIAASNEPAPSPLPRAAAPVRPPDPQDREHPWGAEPQTPSTPVLAVARAAAERPPAPEASPIPPAPAATPTTVAPGTAAAVLASAPAHPAPPAPTAKVEPAELTPRSGPPAGAPRLRVSFLVYSSAPERRSVALTINDGNLTTLREGSESDGISVVRIRPDRVELRWQGETFTLEVRS